MVYIYIYIYMSCFVQTGEGPEERFEGGESGFDPLAASGRNRIPSRQAVRKGLKA